MLVRIILYGKYKYVYIYTVEFVYEILCFICPVWPKQQPDVTFFWESFLSNVSFDQYFIINYN